ncbi:hypothetical protein PHYBOEH_007340 [Phytophthora boehmeriae]|uniref:Cyclic nucleotide-binding domain-containing protein n=1 Tax=Phytophthora boehmeriae TaxID=109152 RepID=A0A8T1X874_9STRA|nr:hypothetical protein PHYBOEH_007340 [Phytophthora boehmeriae]
MAFMIGEFANLFISYIGNEVEYQKNHIAVEMYLGRWKISGELKVRTQAFLSSLWSSHRGVDYQSFLEDVPACIRTESILFIAQTPMRSFVNDIFVPLPLAEELDVANKSVQEIAQYLKFEGYPRGENVVVEGSITRSMYFVVRGHLFSTSTSQLSRDCSFAKGTYFGNYGLLGCSSHRVTNAAYKIATLAVETIKARDDAESGGTVGETEWGEAILRAIRQKQKEVDDARPNPDLFDYDSAVPTDTKAVEVLSSFAALERPIDAFGVFRPMLQLLVPNGQLHNIGGAKVRLLPLISTARKRAEFSSMEQDALIIIGRLFRKNDEAIAREATSSNKSSDIDESKTEESLSGADSEMAAGGLIPPPMIGRKSS